MGGSVGCERLETLASEKRWLPAMTDGGRCGGLPLADVDDARAEGTPAIAGRFSFSSEASASCERSSVQFHLLTKAAVG